LRERAGSLTLGPLSMLEFPGTSFAGSPVAEYYPS
jgi:hypothetical protein